MSNELACHTNCGHNKLSSCFIYFNSIINLFKFRCWACTHHSPGAYTRLSSCLDNKYCFNFPSNVSIHCALLISSEISFQSFVPAYDTIPCKQSYQFLHLLLFLYFPVSHFTKNCRPAFGTLFEMLPSRNLD